MKSIPVETSAVQETTARGAAFLAGLAVGFWPDLDTLSQMARPGQRYEPAMRQAERQRLHTGWRRALTRSQHWIEP